MSELVRLEHRDGGLAEITLDNPPVNALSIELLDELRAVAVQLAKEPPGAVIVTGGPKVFAAGADVSQFTRGPDSVAAVGQAFTESLAGVAAIPGR